ncbi:hypothetical protein bpr_IV194 (plasmid) [Butyrivibrio proteoclasticus B316]|uniref:Zinc-ribbon domain-containing protein n=1 Tax=Butyrivibrio proteoclasticus (strain ATCC 51982 / DSM 14932 / B316) TaxID=515622 RepID=E0S576_BUTPB|nr:hypothetical protein [Butyrivibrio proteoclasticus]ADL36558.1 hypothetical protein bpr_IV194 [Butyrivibrio proteoclasticus B316]
MSQITCNCGNTYDSGFKFCPECAAPNPEYAKSSPAKKKFTKVGESSLNKETSEKKPVAPATKINVPKKTCTIIQPVPVVKKPVQPKPVPQPAALYEEYEDEEDIEEPVQTTNNYQDYDYEDEAPAEEEYESGDYEDTEDYEDEVEEADEPEAAPAKPSIKFPSKGKVLSAPTIRQNRNTPPKMPTTKRPSQTKSSLGKKKQEYDPNHDGYYDDRLPAILDEVTKTSHMDVILKISLSAVCIAALITYCIFYVQV